MDRSTTIPRHLIMFSYRLMFMSMTRHTETRPSTILTNSIKNFIRRAIHFTPSSISRTSHFEMQDCPYLLRSSTPMEFTALAHWCGHNEARERYVEAVAQGKPAQQMTNFGDTEEKEDTSVANAELCGKVTKRTQIKPSHIRRGLELF